MDGTCTFHAMGIIASARRGENKNACNHYVERRKRRLVKDVIISKGIKVLPYVTENVTGLSRNFISKAFLSCNSQKHYHQISTQTFYGIVYISVHITISFDVAIKKKNTSVLMVPVINIEYTLNALIL